MKREQLVDLINSNGGYRSDKLSYDCPFNELELEGILEYGRPEAFFQQVYSDQVVYYSDKKSKLHVSAQQKHLKRVLDRSAKSARAEIGHKKKEYSRDIRKTT